MEFINRFFKELDQRRRVRETMSELSALTDRELDDLGLARGDIRDVAMESVARADQARATASSKIAPAFVGGASYQAG